MSMFDLIARRYAEARKSGRVLVAELGLKTDRQVTVAVTQIEDGIIQGFMVTPSLADRSLAEKPRFRLAQQAIPIAIEAASVFSLLTLSPKHKSLDPELRFKLDGWVRQ